MAYQDDLLAQSLGLVHAVPKTQASLRRSVSTAYYAIFHLLIAEATSNWNNAALRSSLGRAFDHGPMKQASDRVSNPRTSPYPGEDAQVVATLRNVALTFSQLQEGRHFADYNLTRDLEAIDALAQVKSAEKVFQVWPSIRTYQITQEYLVSLVVRR